MSTQNNAPAEAKPQILVEVSGGQSTGKTAFINSTIDRLTRENAYKKVDEVPDMIESDFHDILFTEVQIEDLKELALLDKLEFLEDDPADKTELERNIALLVYASVGRLEQNNFINNVITRISALRESNTKITAEDKAEAVINILDEIAQLTESEADDKIVNVAKAIFNVITGRAPILEFITRIANRIKTRRAARRARRLERRDKL